MSLFLILLAAGEGKRLKTSIPKPYNKINNRTLLEHSLNAFKKCSQIKINYTTKYYIILIGNLIMNNNIGIKHGNNLNNSSTLIILF